MTMDVYVITDDPCLEQYEFSLYKEKDERDAIQKKTFTKWINKHLVKASKRIVDLFEDLRDGDNLISLLEVLSGEHLPRERGRMRVHMLQNGQIALNFLKYRKIKLVNIRPDDIVDANQKLTLGLVWTIILHYQISDIIQHDDSLTFKEALLRWAQRTTEGYPGVRVTDFTSSWRDGLAFNAIIHRNRPDLIDYRSCLKRSARENLESMFQISERELGVTRLLDAEDVDTSHPDEKSLITYISSLYELFPDPCPRNPLLEDEKIRKIEEYRDSAMRMVRWISETTTRLRDRNWPNTVSELKIVQTDHNRFRTEEIASKLQEKQRLSHAYREVSRLALELDTPILIDHEISSDNMDILWNRMMAAHQERDQDLIDSILQLEKLQRLADKVSREAKHCESRLDDIDSTIVETSKRIARTDARDLKLTCEQIASDMKTEGDRIASMLNDVQILLDSKYHKANELRIRVEQLHKRWTEMGFVFKSRVIEAITKRKSDAEKIARIEEYGDAASRLIKWIKESTVELKDRNWPNSLTELKALQTENNRFRSDEIPGKLHEKQRINHLYREVSRMALELSSPVAIDAELSADNIEILWKRMMTAHQDRDHDLLEAILRQEKLQRLAEKVAREMKHCEDRLDDIDTSISDISKRIERGELRGIDSHLLDRISSDMRTESERIAAMRQDVQVLEENRYNRAKELRTGVENLQQRLNEMGLLFESKVSDALSKRKSDEEKVRKIDEYSESALRLVKWMKESATRLKDRSWPNTLSELKALQTENNRFRSDDVPSKLHEKQRLSHLYREVSRMVQELRGSIEIDEELRPENVDILWNRMMAAHQERDHQLLEAILRQEKLERLAEKVSRDLKHCSSRLDGIEECIRSVSAKIDRGDLKSIESQSCENIDVELRTEGERISSMRLDVQVLQENRYHRTGELRDGVENLHSRWSKMGFEFKARVQEALARLRSDTEKMGRIEVYAEAAEKLIRWIESQTSSLQARNWSDSLMELKALQQETSRFRAEEVPPKQSEKQRLSKEFGEISEMALELSHPATISADLSSERIDSLWSRMLATYEERMRDLQHSIHNLEELEKAYERIAQGIKSSESRIDGIESKIHETSRSIERGDMRDVRSSCDQIVRDMDSEADVIARLKLDVQSLISKKFSEAHSLLPRVEDLQKRLNDLGLVYKSEVVEALMRRKSDEESIRKIQEYLDELLSWLSKAEKTVSEIRPAYGDQQVIESDLAKLKVTVNDMDSHQQNVEALNEAGLKLIAAGGVEAVSLKHKLDDLNSRWTELRRLALEKQKQLEQMLLEVMNFNDELQDLLSWLTEVDEQLVTNKPVGGLPETAREQLNTFMDLYDEIESNRGKVESLMAHGADIVQRSPQQTANLQHSLKVLKQRWEHIQSRANDKKVKLEIALREALEFHEALDEFVGWLGSAEKHLANAPPVSRLMQSVSQQIEAHKKLQQDVESHRETMLALDKKGTHLKYFSQKQDVILIKNMMVSVQHRWDRVCAKTTERTRALDQGLREAKDFHDSWHDLIAWLTDAERTLDDVHASENMPDKIKNMLLKHKEFQRALGAKQGTYDATMKTGRTLKEKAPRNDVPVLQEMLEELRTRWNSVCAKSVDRQRKLEESLLFSGQFKEAIDALIDWLDRAKNALSSDRLYGDLDTVTTLVEQHKGFQEDFKSRSKQLAQVRKTASELLQTAVAEDAVVIRQQLSSVESKWEEVTEMSVKKERKLQEALRLAEELHKSVHSLLEWLSDAEMKLRFANSLPDDEEGTRQQIAEHERISREMVQKEVEKERTIRLAEEILTKCHPDAVSTINHWISIMQSRWDEVSQWIRQRGLKLKDHLSSIKELTDLLSELMTWLRRKESDLQTAESIPLPDDIPSIERLIDEHQHFIDDLASRQNEVERVVKAFTTIKKTTEEETGRTSRAKGRYTPLKSSTPTRTTIETEVISPRAAELLDKWHYVWNLAQERMRRLQERLGYVTELERIKNFDFEEWRRRFLAYLNNKKARVMDFYRKIDTDNDCRVTQAEFIEGFLKSSFPTSRLEMERVAPIFDRNSDGFIDHREYLETLRANQDFPKTDLDIIQDEVQKAVAKCTCAIRYKVFHVGDGKYRFGESQKLRLVRILRSTVMVRVGGGWVSLDEFLVKNDPCRAKGRTNVELREQFVLADGVSQSMTPFVSKMRSQQAGRQETVTLPTTGPVTKIREKTEKSMPMYTQRRIESTSDYSFGETDSGTKSRPRSRLTGSGSRPVSRSESRGPPSSRNGSRPASRANSDLSAESIEGYNKKTTTPTRMRFSVTASGLRRTPSSGANGSSAKERWK